MPSNSVAKRKAIAKAVLSPKPKTGRANSKQATREPEVVRKAPNTSLYENAALIDPDKPLTDKQKEFVRQWARGESISTAQSRAGYAGEIGYRMVRMPNILKAYEAEKQKYEEAAQVDRKKVMDMFMEAFDMGKMEADPHAMVSATREIAKMCGYYAPVKAQLTINHTGTVKLQELQSMTDAELAALVGKDEARDVIESIGMEILQPGDTPDEQDLQDGEDRDR